MKLASQLFLRTRPLSAVPLFSYPYKSLFPNALSHGPFVSATYKTLFAQLLSFHIDLNPPGVWGYVPLHGPVLCEGVSPLECAFTPNLPASPLESAFTKNTGGLGVPFLPSSIFNPSIPRVRRYRPITLRKCANIPPQC